MAQVNVHPNVAMWLQKVAVLSRSVKCKMLDAAQIRAARGLLSMSQTKLADLASMSVATVKRIESPSSIRGTAESLWKLQTALEKAGVGFIPEHDLKGSGVRLKESTRSRPRRKRALEPDLRLARMILGFGAVRCKPQMVREVASKENARHGGHPLAEGPPMGMLVET